MVRDFEHGDPVMTWRALLALTALCVLVPSGCAQIQAFRKPAGDPVPFGTTPATAQAPDGTKSVPGDLYASRFKKPKKPDAIGPEAAPESQLASNSGPERDSIQNVSHDEPSNGLGRSSSQGPRVALQTPVAIPSYPRLADSDKPEPAAPTEPLAELALRTEPSRVEPPRAANASMDRVESIVAESRRTLAGIKSYQVTMNRRERVGGVLSSAEEVLLSIRRDPKAVRIEWPSGPHKGREVLYAADARQGMMHVNMADSVVPVPRLSLKPDSPLALKNSRHPITEAGFDTIVAGLEESFTRQSAPGGAAGQIRYDGVETLPGVGRACHKITRVTPNRETWVVYLDMETHLPAAVEARDHAGELLERYEFRDPRLNVAELNAASAFDPDARWGAPRGLFQRLARSANSSAKATESR
jgi:hypothetical protein